MPAHFHCAVLPEGLSAKGTLGRGPPAAPRRCCQREEGSADAAHSRRVNPLLKRPGLSGVVCHSGTQPADLPCQGQSPSPWAGPLEAEPGVTEPQELFAHCHVHPSALASQRRQGQEAWCLLLPAPASTPGTGPRACPVGVWDPPSPSQGRLQMGKLRLREVTSRTQGHTGPKE